MQRVRPDAAHCCPDARRQRALPVLRHASGPRVLGLRRAARRVAACRPFTRGSADFARARVIVALDLLCWLDQRGQNLRDLTQADLDRWLTDGTSTRRAVRYFLQWAHGRGLAGDLGAPLPPRQEPERLPAERDHIRQLDRCLTDGAMPLDLRVGERSCCSSGCWSAGSPS